MSIRVMSVDQMISRITKADRKQQEALDKFFKEETTWCPEHYGWQVLAAIFLFISVIWTMIPCQAFYGGEKVGLFYIFDAMGLYYYMFEAMGLYFYVKRFISYREDQKEKQVYGILQYFPVSGRQLAIYRLRRLMRLCVPLFAVSALSQSFFAVVVMKRFSVFNLLVPAACHLLLPLLFPGMVIMMYTEIGGWKRSK